jgi:hypothetical protein
MNTTTTTTTTTTDQVLEISAAALAWAAGQEFLTQSRCVDVLLDLHQSTDSALLRWTIDEHLSEIRYVHTVAGDAMRAALADIATIATEAAELATPDWDDRLLAACGC